MVNGFIKYLEQKHEYFPKKVQLRCKSMLKLIEISFCGPVNYFRDTDHPGYKSKYKNVSVLPNPIRIVKSTTFQAFALHQRETKSFLIDFTIRILSTLKGLRSKRQTSLSVQAVHPTFLYFDLYISTLPRSQGVFTWRRASPLGRDSPTKRAGFHLAFT